MSLATKNKSNSHMGSYILLSLLQNKAKLNSYIPAQSFPYICISVKYSRMQVLKHNMLYCVSEQDTNAVDSHKKQLSQQVSKYKCKR